MTTPSSEHYPGLHGPFISQRMPDWIRHATPENFAQMRAQVLPEQHGRQQSDWFTNASETEKTLLIDYQKRSRVVGQRLARELKDLKGITAFCEPLLKARLKADLGVEPDIDRDEFVHIERESAFLGSMLKTIPRRQSLMQAALQNFAADSEFEVGTALAPKDAFSLELVPGSEQGYPRFRYRYTQTLATDPQAFARLCHDLDLGGQYQRHLTAVFEHPSSSARRRALAIDLNKELLRVRLQSAFMKQEISEEGRRVLLELLQDVRAPRWNGKRVRCSQLSMFGAAVSDVLVIGPERDDTQVQPVILYLPGAPDAPLKQYASVRAAQDDLRARLRQPAYQALLRRYVPHSLQEHVLTRLQDALHHNVKGDNGVYQRLPDPNANLHLRETFIDQALFGYLQDRHVQKIKDDARSLAVPSAEVDKQAWKNRLAYWASIGFNLLNAAAFFVPSLGAVMAVVAAAQLIEEVVEGAHAWEAGDLAQAWGHFETVGLNIAVIAGLGLAGTALRRGAASEVVDGLVKVRLPNGQQRLWQPVLTDYAQDVELSGVEPNDSGHYRVGEKRYIRIDDGTFEVTETQAGQWAIRHPQDAAAYQPELRHNGQGAWRVAGEQPSSWSRLQLLRRVGHTTEGLNDTELLQAADSSGVSDDELRGVLATQQPLPPLLADTLQRLRLDRQLQAWIGNLRSGTPGGVGRDIGAVLVTEMPGWLQQPVKVFHGPELWGESTVHGLDRWPSAEPFKVVASDLYANRLPEVILRQLDNPSIERLLGAQVQPSDRLQALRNLLASRAEQRQEAIFASIYATPAESVGAQARLLQRDFPLLPLKCAETLVDNANTVELQSLQGASARIPLRLAEEARVYQRQVRLNRAIEGIFEPRRASLDSDRLMVLLLEKMPGWSGEVRVQVHEGSADGQLLAAVGKPTGTLKTLLHKDGRYSAYDAEGNELTVNDDMPGALLRALPDSERQALGLQIGQSTHLRSALAKLATADRLRASTLLGQQPVRPWLRTPMRLADGRIGYPLSGRGAVGGQFSSGLQSQVRSLYPILEPEEVEGFLEELGHSDAERIEALGRRRVEYQQLTDTLNQWVEQAQFTQVDNDHVAVVSPRVLRRVSEQIRKAWRRETPRVHAGDGRFIGFRLELNGLHLSQLPALTADFSHIGELRLSGMGLQSVPSDFLQAFPRLRWLDLSGNRLTGLGDAVGELQGLTKLHLQNNRLVMDQATGAVLARLTSLKALNLNDNPLGQPPAVGTMTQLLNLFLRNTGISTWPPGVFELERLDVLDLRDNRIASIPDSVLEPAEHTQRVDRINGITALHGNPLDADSLQRRTAYQQRTGVNLGLVPVLRGPHVALPAPAQASDIWLRGADAQKAAEVRAHWQALSELADSREFFRLLNDLQSTADFRQGYPALRDRVWRMLKAANDNTRLRQALFELVNHPETCADGVILVFSQLEIQVLVQEAYEAGTAVGAEYALIDLARGLSRLDEVERIALRDIAARRAANLRVDEVQVRLAYRIGLAERLEIPGQPQGMRFANMANVTTAQRDSAAAEVLAAETPEALRAAIASRDFWITFLKSRYGTRFEAVNKPYFARFEALEADKQSMQDQSYRTRLDTITQRREAEERRLIETLTTQIWNSIPNQVTRL
ncbi:MULTISPECIES: NEL-type E3 ubiquitin ligase domain-containing protein [Pseudomonas]|uniref:RING-type E3 ubiquitin transferase n=1 Tax=Pseudomonas fluorescens TaxID=294 RepID=A0A5E6SQJ5_PSEFL|nr:MULTISPECIES: DUF6543 domain-containing protein [Pseudomonas]VVM79585.1 hypothetical protein PS652_02217 [Pseudomonas fluorescens]